MTSRLRKMLPTVRRRRLPAVLGVAALVAGLLAWVLWPAADGYRVEQRMVATAGSEPVSIDTDLYIPDSASAANPVPAVILAHGFGGSKQTAAADAAFLAAEGYLVLAYSARGFGESGGQIGLNSPDFEVKDASAMIDLLGKRNDVVRDGPDDPRVGVTGASYGGALSLLAAGYDDRVDAIVPMVTWNNLVTAFFPQSVGTPVAETAAAGPTEPTTVATAQEDTGVFKKLWAGMFFGAGSSLLSNSLVEADERDEQDSESTEDSSGAGNGNGVPSQAPAGVITPQMLTCGRFRADLCDLYAKAATTGELDAKGAELLLASSPESVLDRITAPTLLIQGESDTLFTLAEADANARGIAANGTTARMVWYPGGHDAGNEEDDIAYLRALSLEWFGHYLKGDGSAPSTGFEFSQQIGLSTRNGRPTSRTTVADSYPGLTTGAVEHQTVEVAGPDQPIASPPGGNPASISSVPGVSGIAAGLGLSFDLPGQAAYFQSEVLDSPVQLVGSPTITLKVASPTGEAVVFAKLYDVDPSGATQLPGALVAPIRLTGLPATLADSQPVEITLPPVAHRFEVGHQLRFTVTTSDQAFLTPNEPTIYQVGLDGGAADLSLPTVTGEPADVATSPWVPFFLITGGLVVLGIVTSLVWRRHVRRREVAEVNLDLVEVPMVMAGLQKTYGDGFVAVKSLSLRVERNQVVGLLGPNGAGKTTALRMLMGLIQPTSGTITVFGHEVSSGAPVLSRIGCFVEGVGFLPHLSGKDNLRLYWRATGRPEEDSHLDEALEIAGLGTAIERKVRTYSQGMRQRLAIAQAMLGLPELLVLDEPTNGLDPPQIAEMRAVLQSYARDGRTVLVSSHQLAEVEQTCTHVVVMHLGELVAQGTVDEIVGVGSSVLFGVDDPDTAEELLRSFDGVREVSRTRDGVLADLNGVPRADLVKHLVGAGVGVQRVAPQRRLEDAFIQLVGGGER